MHAVAAVTVFTTFFIEMEVYLTFQSSVQYPL